MSRPLAPDVTPTLSAFELTVCFSGNNLYCTVPLFYSVTQMLPTTNTQREAHLSSTVTPTSHLTILAPRLASCAPSKLTRSK